MNLGEIDEFLEGQRKTTESQATTTKRSKPEQPLLYLRKYNL